MARVHTVKKARKDYPQFGIKKGDAYYWWAFRFGPTIKSKTYPKRSQLTQSSFLSQLYDLQDRQQSMPYEDLADGDLDDFASEVETLRDECQDSRKERGNSGRI